MGEFADLTVEEYRERALGYDGRQQRPLRQNSGPFIYEDTKPPAEVDWRSKDAVTKVKNQLLVSFGGPLQGCPGWCDLWTNSWQGADVCLWVRWALNLLPLRRSVAPMG